MRRLKNKWWLGLLLGVLFFAPRVSLFLYYRETLFADVASLRPQTYGVLFGAYVLADGTLADVTKERADAAALLYHSGKIQRIFVSATERDNHQAISKSFSVRFDYGLHRKQAQISLPLFVDHPGSII